LLDNFYQNLRKAIDGLKKMMFIVFLGIANLYFLAKQKYLDISQHISMLGEHEHIVT